MDNKRLDLNLLTTLETLLLEQNVTKTARRLHLSQPTVSAQLNRLRDLFDDPLLEQFQEKCVTVFREKRVALSLGNCVKAKS
ncbi:helix-turn-helix domain-containing protein [Mesorhizobium sp. Cs1299R1N3]|uniref:helix-turn-helix domain-containing protein n=1 Tax=Mesorhizobium sp. Cs1299R1N3 TaxID=3015173 RepID=UPI003FA5A4B1